MAKAAKRKPPSRIKYEQSHPNITCRVPKELRDRIEKAKEIEGKSFAYILKIGLGVTEDQNKKLAEARTKSFNDGYRKGYAEAETRFKVTYHCAKCGQPLDVQYPTEKIAIDEYMREKGWNHQQCPSPG